MQSDQPGHTSDIDPEETREWLDALASVVEGQGVERAQYLLQMLASKVTEHDAALRYDHSLPEYDPRASGSPNAG